MTSEAAADLAFRARALAQAHPLSEPARRYARWRVDRDRADHPMPELAEWAATAFLTGYCVRRVEESRAEESPVVESPVVESPVVESPVGESHVGDGGRVAPDDVEPSRWRDAADIFAAALTTSGAPTLLDRALVLAALDDVIGREIDKRADNLREQLGAQDWSQFESFVAWWVVHGYAARAVELCVS